MSEAHKSLSSELNCNCNVLLVSKNSKEKLMLTSSCAKCLFQRSCISNLENEISDPEFRGTDKPINWHDVNALPREVPRQIDQPFFETTVSLAKFMQD